MDGTGVFCTASFSCPTRFFLWLRYTGAQRRVGSYSGKRARPHMTLLWFGGVHLGGSGLSCYRSVSGWRPREVPRTRLFLRCLGDCLGSNATKANGGRDAIDCFYRYT
jgi:hypothetical protein